MAIWDALIHDLAVHHPQLLSHSGLGLGVESCRCTSLPVWWDFLHLGAAVFLDGCLGAAPRLLKMSPLERLADGPCLTCTLSVRRGRAMSPEMPMAPL